MNTQRRGLWYALIGVLVGALVVIVIFRVAQTADLVTEIRHSQITNHQTLHAIKSCTKPDGRCYKRGQKQTARAVSNINRVVILAAACASQEPGQSVARIQACVINRLAAGKP
jgi:hypothetical protein